MSSLISDADKTDLGDVFYQIHDTWKRDIVIYKTAQQVIVNTNPANNILFPGAPFNDQVENVIQSGVFGARVQWNPKQDFRLFSHIQGGDVQTTLKILEGAVRIKLDATGAQYMQESTRYIVDGKEMEILLTDQPHGLFNPSFYNFYLKRVN